MTQPVMVTIERIQVRQLDLNRIKHLFKVEDNIEAVQKALDMASGKIELESIFRKAQGTALDKVYD